ncbi:hypothetical protein O0L34_g13207 [Tuta absoluta]|nr:hypothetical protein O0L34_g13207 [Tuta absoluta]
MDGQTLGGPMHGKVVVCYVATWAVYRPEPGRFTLEDIDPSLCTHLVYSFAGLDEATGGIKSLDAWQDLEKDYGKAGFKRIVNLKHRYPHLKVTIAIGGWNEGSYKYSKMAETPETRAKFIKSVLLFLETYKFDGLDLDWEYPARRDGRPIDKANYVSLVKELNEAFEPHGYILTAALGAGKETMEAAYELTKLSRYLTLIHMMCYDYHGTWDGAVGANAPLTSADQNDVLTVQRSLCDNERSAAFPVNEWAATFLMNEWAAVFPVYEWTAAFLVFEWTAAFPVYEWAAAFPVYEWTAAFPVYEWVAAFTVNE